MTDLARRSLLATEALDARDGASLYRYTSSSPLVELKASKLGDGTILLRGVDVLKVGTYKGLSLGSFELEAMAARFAELRDAGIFLPPFRLDHSFSVMSVIGWIEELTVELAVDPTTGGSPIAYLRADVRLTGSLDYTPAQILAAIKSGALRNRSSELGPYVTNSGEEIPLAFYGCAFVDVPAVEGLAPIALDAHAGPAAVIELSEGNAVEPETEPAVEETVEVEGTVEEELPVVPATEPLEPGPATPEEAEAARQDLDAEGEPVDAEPRTTVDVDGTVLELPADVEDGTDGEPVDDASPAEEEAPAEEPAEEGAALRAEPVGGADELTRLRAENTRLRAEQTERDLETFAREGRVVPANRAAAAALLSHELDEVRTATRTLLAGVPALSMLETVHGRQELSAALSAARSTTSAGGAEPARIELGMSPEEVGALWASLTTAQRAERQPELEAWDRARRSAG